MRIGKVVGRICLNASYQTLVGGRFLLVDGEAVTAGLAGEFHRLLLRLRAPT